MTQISCVMAPFQPFWIVKVRTCGWKLCLSDCQINEKINQTQTKMISVAECELGVENLLPSAGIPENISIQGLVAIRLEAQSGGPSPGSRPQTPL